MLAIRPPLHCNALMPRAMQATACVIVLGASAMLQPALAQAQTLPTQSAQQSRANPGSLALQAAGPESDCLLNEALCGRENRPAATQGPARFRLTAPAPETKAQPQDDDLSALLKAPREVHPTLDAEALIAKFAEHDSSLELVREGKAPVPRIFLARLPHDLPALQSTGQRKAAFIKSVLPLILKANQDVLAKRRRIQAIQQVRRLGFDEGRSARSFLVTIADEYETPADDLNALLRRVDIVPPSQALAQAAVESGWGTSRFARRGNAVFGQRTFKSGRGMVPLARAEGETHEVLAFERLQTSVSAYLWNLNTHFAYADFRKLRARQRRETGSLDGEALAGTLLRYSERGPAYVETIRDIMRMNRLTQFDAARLADPDQLADSGQHAVRLAY